VEARVAAKLYLVVRRDLSPGQQAVQACHAMREFVAEHKETDLSWYMSSNHLALLSVQDEAELHRLVNRAARRGVRFSLFREPDRNDELTAIALEPAARRLCQDLPLALA